MKICSLLPSATEIVCLLGLENELVGITHECDYPPSVKSKTVVTKSLIPHNASSAEIDKLVGERLKTSIALYTLNMPELEKLQPDLIVTQELCDVCAVAFDEVKEAVSKLKTQAEIVSLSPYTLQDVLDDIQRVGDATGKDVEAKKIIQKLNSRLNVIREKTKNISHRPKVLCLEWIDPPMATGHWVPEMVQIAGGQEILGKSGKPSEKITPEQVFESGAEVLILIPCGYDVDKAAQEADLLKQDARWYGIPAVKSGQVFAINGNAYFSRSGPRLMDGVEILAQILHPDLFSPGYTSHDVLAVV